MTTHRRLARRLVLAGALLVVLVIVVTFNVLVPLRQASGLYDIPVAPELQAPGPLGAPPVGGGPGGVW